MKKLTFLLFFFLISSFLFAENIPAEKLVFAKPIWLGSTYVNHRNEVIPLKEAMIMFSECPENVNVMKNYKFKNIAGGIFITTGLTTVVVSSVFYLLANVIMDKDYDWAIYKDLSLGGSICFWTGIFSSLMSLRDIQIAHSNYNLYVMGIPIK